MITEGRVSVNNTVVEELGVQIDPIKDSVRADGRNVVLEREEIYLLLNKPTGYLVTLLQRQMVCGNRVGKIQRN